MHMIKKQIFKEKNGLSIFLEEKPVAVFQPQPLHRNPGPVGGGSVPPLVYSLKKEKPKEKILKIYVNCYSPTQN